MPHAGHDTVNVNSTVKFMYRISIHMPHAGHDLSKPKLLLITLGFQSTCPMRGMTFPKTKIFRRCTISIHMPHAGHDLYKANREQCRADISIHMPHAGHDTVPVESVNIVRISIHMPHAGHDDTLRDKRIINFDISIHMPHAGHDRERSDKEQEDISIHMPHAGHDVLDEKFLLLSNISIHMPHAGHDRRFGWFAVRFSHFNPHAPCGA